MPPAEPNPSAPPRAPSRSASPRRSPRSPCWALVATWLALAPQACARVADRRPVRAPGRRRQDGHRPGLRGQPVPRVFRLHPLPGHLPDRARPTSPTFSPRWATRRFRPCSSRSIPSATRRRSMQDYVSSFDPHVIGLSGGPQAIGAVEKDYRVFARKGQVQSDGGYSMDHSSIVYLMDKTGRIRRGAQRRPLAGRDGEGVEGLFVKTTPRPRSGRVTRAKRQVRAWANDLNLAACPS